MRDVCVWHKEFDCSQSDLLFGLPIRFLFGGIFPSEIREKWIFLHFARFPQTFEPTGPWIALGPMSRVIYDLPKTSGGEMIHFFFFSSCRRLDFFAISPGAPPWPSTPITTENPNCETPQTVYLTAVTTLRNPVTNFARFIIWWEPLSNYFPFFPLFSRG